MLKVERNVRLSAAFLISAIGALLLAGCHSGGGSANAPQAAAALPTPPKPIIRIKCGVTEPWKDSAGNIWMPDTGLFADGEPAERDADLPIANTTDPAMYRTERYGMTSFSYKLPNGKYEVKLHFADTYADGTNTVGARVFSYTVEGHEFKDFDIFAKTGGNNRAYVETVDVEVADGKLDITFTANVENPEINAIEIIPQ